MGLQEPDVCGLWDVNTPQDLAGPWHAVHTDLALACFGAFGPHLAGRVAVLAVPSPRAPEASVRPRAGFLRRPAVQSHPEDAPRDGEDHVAGPWACAAWGDAGQGQPGRTGGGGPWGLAGTQGQGRTRRLRDGQGSVPMPATSDLQGAWAGPRRECGSSPEGSAVFCRSCCLSASRLPVT